jgi:hypothetical protein
VLSSVFCFILFSLGRVGGGLFIIEQYVVEDLLLMLFTFCVRGVGVVSVLEKPESAHFIFYRVARVVWNDDVGASGFPL